MFDNFCGGCGHNSLGLVYQTFHQIDTNTVQKEECVYCTICNDIYKRLYSFKFTGQMTYQEVLKVK